MAARKARTRCTGSGAVRARFTRSSNGAGVGQAASPRTAASRTPASPDWTALRNAGSALSSPTALTSRMSEARAAGSLDGFQFLQHRAQVRPVRSSQHGSHGLLGIVPVLVSNANEQFEQRRHVRSPRQAAQRLPRFLADRSVRRFRRLFESGQRAHGVAGREDADQLRLPAGVVLGEKAGQRLVDPRSPQMDETVSRRLAFGGWHAGTGPIDQRLDGSLVAQSAQGLDRSETDRRVFAGQRPPGQPRAPPRPREPPGRPATAPEPGRRSWPRIAPVVPSRPSRAPPAPVAEPCSRAPDRRW